ncbi:hypothetical protein V2A60_010136 [Cordyceps javanica]|uniref:DUF895 domain membrane protein n=1 Tax=Cordyceps javanica TaxID=43265 RepID=A0A545VU04_9HYPO|nr:DUF895 domain membrane protein [Cordyceps javanica]TQW05197.1 DUF895 domain membrane protein [Cordyceps javanica]
MGLSQVKIGNLRYNSPWAQVIIVGFVAFCSVGMFSAISNLGAGGMQDVQLSDIANSVLYGCFFLGGFFAGSVNNILGPRMTLSMGTTGYALYLGSLWNFQVHGTRWFLILAGAALGFSASLFWAAQGAVMMSYPAERDKGRSYSVFWSLFQLGTLIGSAIALALSFRSSSAPSVGGGVYAAVVVIQLTSVATSWLVLPPHLVVRGDGSTVEIQAAPGPRQEAREFVRMFRDWRMLALLPMCFSSNYFYSYQGAITAFLFNGRTRALVALLTGLGSIVGSVIIGLLTDTLPCSRRTRALAATGATFLMVCAVWGGGVAFQLDFRRGDTELRGRPLPWDWTDSPAAGPIVMMFAYYVVDAAYQGLAYYTMSAITNEPFKLARMAAYYKGIQSAGAAVSFGMDAVKTPYLGELLISWLLIIVSLPLCGLVLMKIRESNYDVEEVARVDEDVDNSGLTRAATTPSKPAAEAVEKN